MKTSKFQLKLENDETVTCSQAGQGSRIGFIAGGPGSFYFTGLSALENEYTFITYDSAWTYGKSSTLAEKKIEMITKESIKQYDHMVVNALKKHFKVDEIDGFGFSAPGAFLFEEALDHPEDFAHIIGTGIGLTELDPSFSKTNTIFNEAADPARKKAFEEHQNKFKELNSYIDKRDSAFYQNSFLFFDVKKETKLPLKPHKDFVAGALVITSKLLFNYSDVEKSKKIIIEHWKHNPFGEHVDKRFQEYFFNKIYPLLNPQQTILELAKKNKPVLLVYGETDFVTPLTEDILKTLSQYSPIKLEIIKGCGHMTYKEEPEKYLKIVRDFVGLESNKREQEAPSFFG